jgi:hypothetical protein
MTNLSDDQRDNPIWWFMLEPSERETDFCDLSSKTNRSSVDWHTASETTKNPPYEREVNLAKVETKAAKKENGGRYL